MSASPSPRSDDEGKITAEIMSETLRSRREVLKNVQHYTKKADVESRLPSPPRNTRSAGGGGIYSGRYKGIVKTKQGQELLEAQQQQEKQLSQQQQQASYKSDQQVQDWFGHPDSNNFQPPRSSTASSATRPSHPRPSSASAPVSRAITSAPSQDQDKREFSSFPQTNSTPQHFQHQHQHQQTHVPPGVTEVDSARRTTGVIVRKAKASTGIGAIRKVRSNNGLYEAPAPVFAMGLQHEVTGKLAHALACRVRPSSSQHRPTPAPSPPQPQPQPHLHHPPPANTPIHTHTTSNQGSEQGRYQSGWDFFTAPSSTDISITPSIASCKSAMSLRKNMEGVAFQHFSLQDALEYLRENPQYPYLHVTSKVFLPLSMRRQFRHSASRDKNEGDQAEDEDRHCTFYDIHVLGIPGTDKSGSLKSKAGIFQDSLLKKNQLMQLSLQGLLFTDPVKNSGDFMELGEFLKEKEIVATLRKKRVFKQFLARKVISVWKKYVSSKVFHAHREALSSKMIFSNIPVLHAVQKVRRATYLLETSVELFAFHEPGAMNLSEFMQLQKEKIERISFKLTNMVNHLGTHLQGVYEKLTSFEYVNVRMQEIIKSHPYSTAIQELKVKFDEISASLSRGVVVADKEWNQVRGVTRLLAEQKTNMEKVLQMGQYMVENSLLKIMFHFWNRLSQTVFGVRRVAVESMDGEKVAMWGTEDDNENAFESSVRRGSMSNSLELSGRAHRKKKQPQLQAGIDAGVISKDILSYVKKPFLDPTGTLTYIAFEDDEEMTTKAKTEKTPGPQNKFGSPVRHTQEDTDEEDEDRDRQATLPSPTTKAKTPISQEDMILSSGALTGQAGNYFVSNAWLRKGSYLSVDTALVFTNDANKKVMTTEYSSWSLNDVKIRSYPHRLEMVTQLHLLYNALGHLLDETPNLVKRKFFLKCDGDEVEVLEDKKDKTKTFLSDEEIESINHSSDMGGGTQFGGHNNTRYFNTLKSSAILSSPQLFEIAVRCMHQFRAAYMQSVDIDAAVLKLQDIFRKIWTISPEFLCRQLDRSAILPKIRELIDFDATESLTDIEAVLERDAAKITGFKNTVNLLKSAKSLSKQFGDIKNSLGLITSFKTIISQIEDANKFKTTTLFLKLPQACITRMNNVNLFIRKLKSYFQNEDPDIKNIVFLLLKLKNFDEAKDLLEAEFDFCNDIYSVVLAHENAVEEERIAQELLDNPGTTRESLLAQKNNPSVGIKIAPINYGDLLKSDAAENAVKKVHVRKKSVVLVTVHTSYQVYAVERDSLFDVVSKCRMFLLYRLKTAGEEIKNEILDLHKEIVELTAMVTACNVVLPAPNDSIDRDSDGDESDHDIDDRDAAAAADKRSIQLAGEVYSALNKCKARMTQVRDIVDSNMKAQRLIVDAHMIVGAADCFLEVKHLDNFVDMDNLEKFFTLKYRSCSSILDASMTVKKLHHSKLVTVEVTQVYKKYLTILENRQYLMEVSDGGDSSIACLSRLLQELTPMLQVATFFKSKYMKFRHWEQLNRTVMPACNLQLVTSAGVSAANITLNHVEMDPTTLEKNVRSLGTLRSQQVKTLLDHGMLWQMETLSNIAADACIEGMIEKTLEAVDHAMKTMKVVISLDWLEDKIFRNKIFFQLHRITNCVQISVNIQYCLKALTICEHTAFDMNIEIFDDKIHFIRLMLQDMYILIGQIDLVQKKWISVFHYMKFTTSGEIEREIERYFQQCTEEIKKIEVAVQSSPSNTFYAAFHKINELSFAIDSISSSLVHVQEDVHGIVQSMLDGYPRLSILPYHRTKKLIRAWLVNPHEQMGVITRCITDIFPGVGKLTLIKDEDSLLPIVQGICSNDGTEVLNFSAGIRMEVTLDEFLKTFEFELRSTLALMCDALIVDQIELSREYFLDHRVEEILITMKDFFATRLDPILNTSIDRRKLFKPNQCNVLVNMALFAEHLWFCFGYAVGIVDICRPDFAKKGAMFSAKWRELVQELISVCKKNVKVMQLELQEGQCDEKTRKLYICLFQMEISFIQCMDEILCCPCLDSAIEQWAGRYQLRFLYDKAERWRDSPFEVTLGCVGVAYGLEYQGGDVRSPIGHTLENALQKVIGSAFVSKGTVFVSQDSENTPTESIGEYCVSCSDVADALGRLYTTLSSVQCERSVQFFLTRLCVLDAVGCIDFANLSHNNIQLLMSSMTKMWTSIEKKDDQYIAKGLKYPLFTAKDNALTNPVQNGRQKNTMLQIRKNFMGQGKAYSGIFVVGLASESLNSDVNLLDYISKSVFNTVAVNYNRPVDDLGLLLCTRGFKYGFLLQLVMQEVIYLLHNKYNYQDSISYLSSSLLINTIVNQCNTSLICTRQSLSRMNHVPTHQELLRIEVECLYTVLLEQVILLGQCSKEDLVEIHKDVRHIIQQQLNTVLDKTNRFVLSDSTFLSEVVVSYETKGILNRAMKPLGLLPGGQFLQQCSTLWKSICCLQSMVIVSGPAGCGKSSMIKCALEALRNEGISKSIEISNLIALEHWRAASTLIRVVKKWLSLRQNNTKKAKLKSTKLKIKTKFPVQTTVIHHASLPTEHLIGSFDENGRWMDGMLLRKLRETDEDVEKEINNRVGVESAQIIILDGPVGSNLEQIFTHSTYLSRGMIGAEGDSACKLVFPTGERTHLHGSVAMVLETSDLSHASPSLLMHTAHIHCGVAPSFASKRLLTVWLRSLCNWLRPYPCWIEPLNDINRILLRTDFIKEILTCDMSVSEMNAITAFSRMSTFIRYLEELLQQCHSLVVTTSGDKKTLELDPVDKTTSFSESEGDDDDEGEEELSKSAYDSEGEDESPGEINSDLAFDISLKEKEKLIIRVHLSLIYAAVWGFGGAVNGTERRVFFDRLVKDAAERYISKDLPEVQDNLLMFEVILDLPQCCFKQALNLTPLVPKSFFTEGRGRVTPKIQGQDTVPLSARLEATGTSSLPELVLLTPSSLAVKSAFEVLVKGGGNVMFMGPRGSGKSRLISESLQSLGEHCPNPTTMKSEIMDRLIDIIGDEAVPDGIPSILELVRKLVYEATFFDSQHDDEIDDISLWKKIRQSVDELLPDLLSKHDIHRHFEKKTLYTVKTSLCSTSNATLVRDWLVRELRSECQDILESPRETYAMVFIDDFHLIVPPSCCSSSSSQDGSTGVGGGGREDGGGGDEAVEESRVVENKVESLLKGLISQSRPYRIVTDTRVPADSSYAKSTRERERDRIVSGNKTNNTVYNHRVMPTRHNDPPVLHKSFVTDPTKAFKAYQNNYFVNQLGVITACSGDHKAMQSQACFSQVLAYFSVIAVSQMTTAELHTGFQQGAVEAMVHGNTGVQRSDSLFLNGKYLQELVKGTLYVMDSVLSSGLLLSPLEHSLQHYITPNLQWIGRFCGTFSLATKHLNSTSSLLQLWTHEWKRFTLDPLPNGVLKSRLMWSFKKKLNEIDQNSWGLDSGWLQNTIDKIEVNTDDIWMNANCLMSAAYRMEGEGRKGDEENNISSIYRPVEFRADIPVKGQGDNNDGHADANLGAGSSFSFNQVLVLPNFVGTHDVRAVLYPEAFSYVLRIVRLLSSVGTNIILPSHVGSHAVQALKLASCICDMKFFIFDCKDKCEVSAQLPSPQTLYSNDFKSFLKESLLAVGGFKEVIAPNIKGSVQYKKTQASRQVQYTCVKADKVLMVVTSTQLMSDEDRRLLQYAVDQDNPCLIFDNREITGLISAARSDPHSNTGGEGCVGDCTNAYRRNIKKELQAGRFESEEFEEVGGEKEKEGLTVLKDRSDWVSDSGSSDDDVDDEEEDDMYISITDPPVMHLEHEMMKNGNAPPAPRSSLDVTAVPSPHKQDTGGRARQNKQDIIYESLRTSSAVPISGTQPSVAPSHDAKGYKGSDEFQTYVYQLIKSRLVSSVRGKLKTVLCLDIPRAKEVFTTTGTFQFHFHAKVKPKMALKMATVTPSHPQDNAEGSSAHAGGDGERKQSRASALGLRRPSRRFSMQSKSIQHQNVFQSATKRTTNLNKNTNSGNGNSAGGSSHVGFVSSEASASPTTETFLASRNILMQCPILASVLLRRFSCLFWHIDRSLAVTGVCSAMLGVGKQRLLSSKGVDLSTDTYVDTYTLPLQLCRVGGTAVSVSQKKTSGNSNNISNSSSNDNSNNNRGGSNAPSLPNMTTTVQLRVTMKNHVPKVSNLEKLGIWGTFSGESLLSEEDATFEEEKKKFKQRSVSIMVRKRMAFIRQSSRVDTSASAQFSEDMAHTMRSMTTEAETLLAQLLAVPLPCDHVMLTQPVLCVDAEKSAEIACTVVRFILESGGQSLLRRKMHLITSLILEDEAAQFLTHLDANTEKLNQLIEEITNAIRDNNSEMSVQWGLIESAQQEALNMEDFQTLYEGVAMAQEDWAASVCEAKALEARIDDAVQKELDILRKIKPTAWVTFGGLFQAGSGGTAAGSVEESHVLLMSALLGLTGRIPLEAEGGEYRMTKVRLSDDAIVKQAASMLKTTEFIEMVLQLHPSALSDAQIAHLADINAKLAVMVDFRKQAERHKKQKKVQFDSNNSLEAKNAFEDDVVDIIKEKSVTAKKNNEGDDEEDEDEDEDDDEEGSGEGDTTAGKSSGHTDLEEDVKELLHDESESSVMSGQSNFGVNEQDSIGFDYFEYTTFNLLVNFLDKLQESVTALHEKKLFDKTVAMREKNVATSQEALNTALYAHIKELKQVYKELEMEHHAYDAELARNRLKLKKLAPLEEIKQDYLEALSQNMLYVEEELNHVDTILKYLVADSCVAAALMVRTGWLPEQLRQESHDALKSYISTLSIEHSDSPYLLGCMMDRLQVRLWTQYTKGHLPRDVQSINAMSMLFLAPSSTFIIDPEGVAAKAIMSALSRDYEVYSIAASHFSLVELEKQLALFGGRLSDDDFLGFTILVTDLQAGVTDDLVSFLSAEVDFVPAATESSNPRERRKQTTSAHTNNIGPAEDVGVAFNPTYHTEFSPQNLIQLSKVRVILISTQPPTLDTQGIGSPLPPACFKQTMVVLQWISAAQSSFFVDSKLLNTAMNKDHCGSSLLESVFVESLCKKISPTHLSELNMINSRIVDYYYELASVENSAFNAIIDWTKYSADNQADPLRIERDLYEKSKYLRNSTPVKLGVLDSQHCMNILKEAVMKRAILSKQILMVQALERDRLLYSAALMDVCSMSASFFRMAGALLPAHVLPPHALTSVCIGAKCVQEFINKPDSFRLLTRIPTSMIGVRNVMDPLRAFQKLYADYFKRKRMLQTQQLYNSVLGHGSSSASSFNSPLSSGDDVTSSSTPGALWSRRKASDRRISISTDKDISFLIESSSNHSLGSQGCDSDAGSGPVSSVPGRIMRESCYARKISKAPTPHAQRMHRIVKSLRLEEFVNIPISRREGLTADLAVLTQPLHSLLLNASVAYLLENVRPGMEWLVKFCLVLCTWSASVPLPVEEVRILKTFIENQACAAPTYFQLSHPHAQSATPLVVVIESGQKGEMKVQELEGATSGQDSPSVSRSGASKRGNKGRVSLRMANRGSQRVSILAKHAQMRTDMFLQFTKGVRKNVLISNRVQKLLSETSKRHAALGRPVRSKTTLTLAKRMVPVGDCQEANTAPRSTQSLSSLERKMSRMTSWSGKGNGPLDGVWVSRRSLRYKINYLQVLQRFRLKDGTQTAGPKHQWDVVFCEAESGQQEEQDEEEGERGTVSAHLVAKNIFFRPTVRMEDEFLSEYLRLMGMRSANETGGATGGAAAGVQTDMANRVTLLEREKSLADGEEKEIASCVIQTHRQTRRVSNVMAAKSIKRDSGIALSAFGKGRLSAISRANSRAPTPPPLSSTPSATASTDLRRAMRSRTLRRQSTDTRVLQRANIGTSKGLVPAPTETTQPFGFNNRKQSKSTRIAIEERTHLSRLLTSSISVQNFRLLEKHSALAPVFKGMEEGILNYQEEFETWKNFMESLVSIDFTHMTEEELVILAAKVVPPQLNPDHLSDKDKESVGCWALGKELTILQTLILTSVLVPQAVEGVFSILFALLSTYLQRGNVILKHADEFLLENEDSEDEDDVDDVEDWIELSSSDDEVEVNNEGNENMHNDRDAHGVISVAALAGMSKNKKIKKYRRGDAMGFAIMEEGEFESEEENIKNREDEEDEEDEEDDEDENDNDVDDEEDDIASDMVFSDCRRSSIASSVYDTGAGVLGLEVESDRFQENTFLFNSWTHLKRIAANKEVGIRIRLSRQRSPYLLCCRDYENFEEVLLSCLRQPNDTKKFQLISQLRNTFDGKAPLFLSFNHTKNNTATLTNRAREYANQNSLNCSQMTVLNCHFNSSALGESTPYRVNMCYEARMHTINVVQRFIRRFSAAVLSKDHTVDAALRSTSVESLDLYSSLGNSILSASLTRDLPFDLKQITGSVPFKRFDSDPTTAGVAGGADAKTSTGTGSILSGADLPKQKKPVAKPPSAWSRGSTSVLMSAKWTQRQDSSDPNQDAALSRKWYGTGPALAVGLLKFHWLSEHSTPDLIGCAHMSSLSPGAALMVSRDLSFGAIGDELEGQLHWVMNSLRRVTNTRMIKSVRERIRYSSKLDLRTLSCVIVLWRFALSLECKLRELNQQPAQWSSVLVPLSLWQLARLTLKVSDMIFQTSWQTLARDYNATCSAAPGSKGHLDGLAKRLLKDSSFVKAICLMAESFTKISFRPEDHKEEEESDSDEEGEGKSVPPPPSSTPVPVTGGRSRLSMLIKEESNSPRTFTRKRGGNLIPTKGFLATYKVAHDEKMASEDFALGEKLAAASALKAKKERKARLAAGVKDTDPRIKSDAPEPGTKEKPSEKRRRLRDEKKAALILAANSNYMSFESLSSVNLYTLGPDSRLFIQKEMKKRFFGTLSVFFAGVIYSNAMLQSGNEGERINKNGASASSAPARARTSSSEACHPMEMSSPKTTKSKEDPNTSVTAGGTTYKAAPKEEEVDPRVWPHISPRHSDITIGSLMPHEVITTLVSWTFDGKNIQSGPKKKAMSKFKFSIGLMAALHKPFAPPIPEGSKQEQERVTQERFQGWQGMNRMKEELAAESSDHHIKKE